MKRGFTLIESIVVIAIIAILAAIIAPSAFRAIEKAKVAAAISDLKAFKNATYAFYADTGDWPIGWAREGYYDCGDDNGFLTNVRNWPGWDGPYLEKMKGMDPWGGAYCYEYFDVDQNGSREYFIEFNTHCYPHDVPNGECPVPLSSAQKIDRAVDDGNFDSGEVRRGGQYCGGLGDWDCLAWVIVWDTGL